MKIYPVFVVAILAALVVSCGGKKPDRDYTETSVPLADSRFAVEPLGPTPKQIADEKCRVQDSIRVAEKAAEEERIKLAQIEEDKNMKVNDAKIWAEDFSKQFMKIVSPLSGKNMHCQVLLDESTYNPDTKTLTAVFQTEWDAIATYAGGSPERHMFKGKYIIYGTGETRAEGLFKNEVLSRAIEATNGMNELNELLNRINSND